MVNAVNFQIFFVCQLKKQLHSNAIKRYAINKTVINKEQFSKWSCDCFKFHHFGNNNKSELENNVSIAKMCVNSQLILKYLTQILRDISIFFLFILIFFFCKIETLSTNALIRFTYLCEAHAHYI